LKERNCSTIGNLSKVLILSVSVGAGHMRTAEALKKATGFLYPAAEVIILDTFRYISPLLEKVMFGTYMEVLKMTPALYGYLYRQAEHGKALSGRGKLEFNRIINALAAPKLNEYIQKLEPQIIVCTHPFPLGIVAQMKNRGIFEGPLFAAITDFTIHSFWLFPEVDFYIIGSEHLITQCEGCGIEHRRVLATGIPIDPAFGERYEKLSLRQNLGLDPELTTILIMGGGLGLGPLLSSVKTLGNHYDRCQLIVVTGTNKTLSDKLARIVPELSCKVKTLGFVDNIHELMQASDFMIGKAGGLTCAEALATGLPMFIVDPLPGQEVRNTEFITGLGAGQRVEEKNLADMIRACLLDPKQMERMARAASNLGKPGAACSAVKFMAKTLPGAQVITR
jgi:processive 1,2-diacylglycerol beta-glucosyltransferase